MNIDQRKARAAEIEADIRRLYAEKREVTAPWKTGDAVLIPATVQAAASPQDGKSLVVFADGTKSEWLDSLSLLPATPGMIFTPPDYGGLLGEGPVPATGLVERYQAEMQLFADMAAAMRGTACDVEAHNMPEWLRQDIRRIVVNLDTLKSKQTAVFSERPMPPQHPQWRDEAGNIVDVAAKFIEVGPGEFEAEPTEIDFGPPAVAAWRGHVSAYDEGLFDAAADLRNLLRKFVQFADKQTEYTAEDQAEFDLTKAEAVKLIAKVDSNLPF